MGIENIRLTRRQLLELSLILSATALVNPKPKSAFAEPSGQVVDPREEKNARELAKAEFNAQVKFVQPRIIGIWQSDDLLFANVDLGKGRRVPVIAADCLVEVLGDKAGVPVETTGDTALTIQKYWPVDLRVKELTGRRLGVPGVRRSDFIAPVGVKDGDNSETCRVSWLETAKTIANGAARLAITNTGRTVEQLIEAAKKIQEK